MNQQCHLRVYLLIASLAIGLSLLVLLLPISAAADATTFDSDDFNSFNLDTGLWTFIDPVGDATLTMMGTNTSDAWVSISVPAGTDHDICTDGNRAARIMQPADNTDFEIEVKFESSLSETYQTQGVLVEQDGYNFLRLEFHSSALDTNIYAVIYEGETEIVSETVEADSVVTGIGVAPLYMRVTRVGNQWTQSYSFDGATWATGADFTHVMTVTKVGVFVGNAIGASSPAHSGYIDYFFNTASPINPEDGGTAVDNMPPLIYNVQARTGETELTITWSTDEPATGTVKYGETTAYELGSVSHADLAVTHTLVITDLQPDTTYNYQVISQDSTHHTSTSGNFVVTTRESGSSFGPTINVWDGPEQAFGQRGLPQTWINILGNVSDTDGVASLVYSLNGLPASSLSIGSDGRRLVSEGDFNIDILHTDLVSGTNQVVITATDQLDHPSVKMVTVTYSSGNVWPLPYLVDWSSATSIQDVAQVVDGSWALLGDRVRTLEPGYDRLIAIGDVSWTDYEVTVPVTIHDMTEEGGTGILMRWNGHTDNPVSGWQPKSGWLPLGAIGWYRPDRLEFWGNDDDIIAEGERTLVTGVTYIFKMRVETMMGQGGLYRLKVWQEGATEPSGWDLTAQEELSDPQNGSITLISHLWDASFGDVTVVPLTNVTTTLQVVTVGSGTVDLDPDPPYTYGQVVTLTAITDPGWTFAAWSGDLSGSANPETKTITSNHVVTATFTQDEYTLSVGVVGSGSVVTEPVKSSYHYGDVVTFTAIPDPGWTFAGWSGDLSGSANPETRTITGTTVVKATFTTPDEYTLTVDYIGGGRVIRDPDQPAYHYGDVVTLTAVPDPGWRFAGWSGALSGNKNPATVTITGSTSVTATFVSYQVFLPLTIVQHGD